MHYRVVTFLVENDTAMDSVKGIATWWLSCDEVAAQACLDRLVACHVVAARPMASGIYYGLTPDPDIRQFLRQMLAAGVPEATAAASHLPNTGR